MLILILSCTGKDRANDQKARLRYINKKYMFTLQFPERWGYYMDFEKKEIIDPQIVIPIVFFALPTKSREWQPLNVPAGYSELFYVRIFTHDQWKLFQEKYKSGEDFPQNDRLFTTGKNFVYMIRYPVSIPVDLYHYMKESESVTATFKIIK